MPTIEFNQGFKEYDLGGDPNKVIRFIPSDFNLPGRIKESIQAIDKIIERHNRIGDGGNGIEEIASCDAEIKELINYIFDSDVSSVVFGNTNCMSMAGGQPLCVNFLNAILPIIQESINDEKKKSEKNIAKYTSQVK